VTTGFIFSERYLWHETGSWSETSPWLEPSGPPEGPEPKRRIRNLLEVTGLLDKLLAVAPRQATRAEVERFHHPAYVDRIVELSRGNGGNAGNFTPFGRGSYEIALLAAGGVIAAVDAVLDCTVSNAYALVRPPGHHASPEGGDGFCLLNNIGIAVHHARRARGVRRVAIVDWDVHHGNGTESGFYDDPDVLTISVHQDGWYPAGRGSCGDNGAGRGAGANLNIPLPAGCGSAAYELAFDRVVGPALQRFEPELIVVASGLDANSMDPYGRMLLDSDSFRALAARMRNLAEELCAGRLVLAHEGGYSAEVVPFCALAIIEVLSGVSTGVEDPFLAINRASPGQDLVGHQAAAIEAAAALVGRVPRARS
jgi:acetoin utilization deacetylase AcuC-like enzyme